MRMKLFLRCTSELVCDFVCLSVSQFRDFAVEGAEADQNSGPLTTTATFSDNTASAAADRMADTEEGGQYFVDQETGQYYYQVREHILR